MLSPSTTATASPTTTTNEHHHDRIHKESDSPRFAVTGWLCGLEDRWPPLRAVANLGELVRFGRPRIWESWCASRGTRPGPGSGNTRRHNRVRRLRLLRLRNKPVCATP